ncbi:MAG: hypothetical protein HQ472_04235 [Ignavibacteria bacterium]|nr:hypothetical protein [Ignavibacteria bacterium]
MQKFLMAMIVVMCAIGGTAVNAQTNQSSLAPAPQQPVMIKPKMKLADVKAVTQFIAGVDIRGTEVDAYLDTRKILTETAEAAAKSGKRDEDAIAVEMRLDQAQNLFTLMQRGQLKGAEAEKWREIVASLQEAVKAAQPSK